MDGIMSTGVRCEDFDELKKRVHQLEYEDLKEVRRDIQSIKEDMAKSNVLLQQSISSSEKLNNTLDTVQHTMIQLTESMKSNNAATNSLSKKVSNLEDKLDNVENKVENKGKIDMVEWLQKNWTNVAGLVAILTYIVLGQYVKF